MLMLHLGLNYLSIIEYQNFFQFLKVYQSHHLYPIIIRSSLDFHHQEVNLDNFIKSF
jgi:hypothetical protein